MTQGHTSDLTPGPARRAAGVGPTPPGPDLERYRAYLTLLARGQVGPRLRDPRDVSGVVQQTFLEAHQNLAAFRGTPEQLAGWLRQILARNLADALRALGAARRDAGRHRSLEQELERSGARLGGLLADAGQSSPSLNLRREERAVALADALARLPAAQREALVLQHWHGRTLDQIAGHLNRTPAAVAGLLHRGLRQLRAELGGGGPDGGAEP